ncbi:MAG: ATP-binding protein [Cyanobacteria bacterium J06638_22]
MLTPTASQTTVKLQGAIAPNPLITSPQTSIREAMTKMYRVHRTLMQNPITPCPDATASVTQERFYQEARASCVLVVEAGTIMGILTEADVVRWCATTNSSTKRLNDLPIAMVMDTSVVVLAAAELTDTTVAQRILAQMAKRPIPVVGDHGEILGLMTRDTLRTCQDARFRETVTATNGQTPSQQNQENPYQKKACEEQDSQKYPKQGTLERFFLLTPDLACITTLDGRLDRCNQAWETQLGYSLDDLSGQRFTQYVHPDDRALTLDILTTLNQAEALRTFVNRYRCRDGSYRDMEWQARSYNNWIYLMARDLTEQRQAEQHLRQQNAHLANLQQTTADLAASNRELEAFSYSVSHDLRSPLRVIDGFSHALLTDYGHQLDDIAQDYCHRIRRNVHRMGSLIDALLHLARISRTDMRFQPLNLSQLVLDHIKELQAAEPERQVKAIVAPDVMVYADPILMGIAISNLVHNAWKFTSHHPTARIEFGVEQAAENPIYFISDDGAGFDMAYADMLFGAFQRLHHTHEFPGTGIGLATVQRAIHRHGGTLWAEGAVEQGAIIYFTLPQRLADIEPESIEPGSIEPESTEPESNAGSETSFRPAPSVGTEPRRTRRGEA